MNAARRTLTLIITATLTGSTLVAAQTNSTATPATRVVQGTNQLAGDAGELGKTFTIGKDTDAVNFTLNSVEYSVSRVTVGEHVYVPNADQKLLVLRYTVHNPQKTDKQYGWNTVKFTVVDAKDVTHVHDNYVGREGTTDRLDITLKPAQKIDAYAVIAVPAAGPVPKLIVSVNDQQGVIRYDLRGKARTLAAPFADPADASRTTALEVVPANAGTYVPLGVLDVKLESVAFTQDVIAAGAAEEGKRRLVAVLGIRNGSGKTANAFGWSFGTFKIRLVDADGEEVPYEDYLFKATRNEHADGSLRPGEEARFRVYFDLPEGVAGKSLSVQEGESRTVTFDVSGAK